MVTRQGFVGLAPRTMLMDRDVIIMVKGARVPLILRPAYREEEGGKPEFVLVGSCYVLGLTDWIIKGSMRRHIFTELRYTRL